VARLTSQLTQMCVSMEVTAFLNKSVGLDLK